MAGNKKRYYRCDTCSPAVIFSGRSLYDLHMRTHKRLSLNRPPKPDISPPDIDTSQGDFVVMFGVAHVGRHHKEEAPK